MMETRSLPTDRVLPGVTQGMKSRLHIVDLVRRGWATTRGDLGRLTGLSRSVISQVVAELVAEGLLVQSERDVDDSGAMSVARGRGRPSVALQVAARPGQVAAVEFGHHHVGIAVGDLLNRVHFEERWDFPVDVGAPPAFEFVGAMLGAALKELQISEGELLAVAVSTPFPVVHGTVHPYGDVPGWRQARPEDLMNLPGTAIVIDNDANLGAWGEYICAPDNRVGSLAYFRIGDGLGAGLVVDGQVFGGAHGMSGEIGHVAVTGCTVRCRCGRVGCLDALVSAATATATTAAVQAAGAAVGTTLAQLASFFDPDVIVLGGSLGFGNPAFFHAAMTAYHAHGIPDRRVTIQRAQLGLNAERAGAFDRACQAGWLHHIVPGIG